MRIAVAGSDSVYLEFDPGKAKAVGMCAGYRESAGPDGHVVREATGTYTMYLEFEGEENRPQWVDSTDSGQAAEEQAEVVG